MNSQNSPLVSEHQNAVDEASYNTWLTAKVQKSLADTRPLIPHEQVMAEAFALLQQKQKKYAAG